VHVRVHGDARDDAVGGLITRGKSQVRAVKNPDDANSSYNGQGNPSYW